MDVRGTPVVSIYDHLVHKLNNGTVLLAHPLHFLIIFIIRPLQLPQDILDAARISHHLRPLHVKEEVDHLHNVLPQGHTVFKFLARDQPSDCVPGRKEIRIFHGNNHLVAGLGYGDEIIFLEKGRAQVLEQVPRNDHFFVIVNKLGFVVIGEGFSNVFFGYVEIRHEHGFHLLLGLSGISDGPLQVFVRDDIVGDQVVKSGGFLPLDRPLILKKGHPEDLGDLQDRGLVLQGKMGAPFLVDELNAPEEVFIV